MISQGELMSMSESYYIGIDVGTGSARAGIFDNKGKMLGSAVNEITMWKPQPDFVEQSTNNIWDSCCKSVKEALSKAGLKAGQIKGIGFDATASFAALDDKDNPVTVSPTGNDEQNVVVWMDHRAIKQAERINATKHKVLQYVGGIISPEMVSPKLLWLKENLPDTWKRTGKFLDLVDFLTYRATGKDVRSLCSTVCKWTYQGHEEADIEGSVGRWDGSYWKEIGMGDLVDEGFKRIGTIVRPMGERVGKGLTEKSASELGLAPGTPVSVSIIDAHAGGLGLLGAALDGIKPTPELMEKRVALIGGTSTCHMSVSREPFFIPGIWGPYFSAMVPGMWLTEGGQSATGALVDHVIFSHAKAAELKSESQKTGLTVYEILNNRLDKLSEKVDIPAYLTKEFHVLPYFHGNRSPRANPTLKGMISGLKLSDTPDDLALLYLATIQAIAYGTKHIISDMNSKGYRIDTMFACGGGTKNRVFIREHADITGCRVVLPEEPEAVLLGSAILGAVASGDYKTILDAMADMNKVGEIIEPAKGETSKYHEAKYKVFQKMYEDQMAYKQIMK